MRLVGGAGLLLALALVLAVVGTVPADEAGEPVADNSIQRANFKMPKLFRFDLYMRLFNKTYASFVETMVRAKRFMSRSMRVFISAFKYINRQLDYYLSVNHMSDMTDAELAQMNNKLLDEMTNARLEMEGQQQVMAAATTTTTTTSSSVPDVELADDERPLVTLVELLKARADDPSYRQMLELLQSSDGPPQSELDDRLAALMDAKQGEHGHAEIAEQYNELKRARRGKRVKRQAPSLPRWSPPPPAPARRRPAPTALKRSLHVDELINLGAGLRLPAEAAKKIARRPHSNNPYYRAPNVEPVGMVDQQVPVKIFVLGSKRHSQSRDATGTGAHGSKNHVRLNSKSVDEFLGNLHGATGSTANNAGGGARQSGASELPDEVFDDLRQTNCLFLPRNQGICGSCYAFAAISLMEYLYCRKTGELLAFSEQYVLDCGRQYIKGGGLSGCQGGFIDQTPHFFQNFGLERRSIYPYRMKDSFCPYNPEYDLKRAGFVRTNIRRAWKVPVEEFASVLKFSPIMVSVRLAADFSEYGGGVHPGNCDQSNKFHAMLVIGHGRESNQDYWLVRNSFSVGWGVGGYYKLSKATNCIDENAGFILGSDECKRLDLTVEQNQLHNETLIQEHYFKHCSI
jgi:hypothetical protein